MILAEPSQASTAVCDRGNRTTLNTHIHARGKVKASLYILDQRKLLGFRKENKSGLPTEEKIELLSVQQLPEGQAEFPEQSGAQQGTGERAGVCLAMPLSL